MLFPPPTSASAATRCSPASGPSTSTSAQPQSGHFGFEAVVEVVEYLGDERLAHVRLGERSLVAKLPADEHLESGTTVAFAVPREAVIFFDAESGVATDQPF